MADPLSVASSVVGVISLGIQVTQSLFDYYESFQSQYSDATHIAQKLGSLSQLLNHLNSALGARTFRPDEEELVNNINSSIQNCTECIEELKSEAEKLKKTPLSDIHITVRAIGRRVAYPFRQSTLQKLEEDVDDLVSQISFSLQLLQRELTEQVHDDVEYVKKVIDLIRTSQISSEIHSWLEAPDVTTNFYEVCEKKHRGTGLWFIEGPAFITWLETPGSFLWLNGFAGCGKSVLCSTAIQRAFRHRGSRREIGIAFFYFTFSDERKQDTSHLLRSLVFQLSGQLGGTPAVLMKLHESYRNSIPSNQALLGCLHQLLRSFKDVYIFLDALDEIPKGKRQQSVLQTIEDICGWSEPGLHFLVTSRDEVDIRESLNATPEQTIVMRSTEIDKDIASFVRQHLRSNRRLRKWEDHYEHIEKVLIKKAKGVFRWVECQFESLINCPVSEQLLEQLLESLPPTLDETYQRMLQNIPPEARGYAQRMLIILCGAMKPLTVTELIDAIAVELGDKPRLNPKGRLKNVHALQQLCPGFTETSIVQIQPGMEEVFIVIAHFSIQEYLESDRIRAQSTVAAFGISKQLSHNIMVGICLTILLQPELQVPSNWGETCFSLAVYAARRLIQHYEQSSKGNQIEEQVLKLFQNAESYSAWMYLGNSTIQEIPSPIYVAAVFECISLLKSLCEDARNHDSIAGKTFPDILNAAYPFFSSKSPLNYITDTVGVKKFENNTFTSLQLASSLGRTTIARLLLDHGADVNCKGFGTESPLYLAVRGEKTGMNQLLLSHGADANDEGYRSDSLLSVAVQMESTETVQLLLSHGADANDEGCEGDSVLSIAVQVDKTEIVQLLLNHGADANDESKEGESLLNIAIEMENTEMVQLLLSHGADANISMKDDSTPLQYAIYQVSTEIVQLLLSHGADANEEGAKKVLPLELAFINGYTEIVRLLIDHGVDHGVDGNETDDELILMSFASRHGIIGEVQRLLIKGVQPSLYVVNTALESGHTEIAELLLSKAIPDDNDEKEWARIQEKLSMLEKNDEASL